MVRPGRSLESPRVDPLRRCEGRKYQLTIFIRDPIPCVDTPRAYALRVTWLTFASTRRFPQFSELIDFTD